MISPADQLQHLSHSRAVLDQHYLDTHCERIT